MGRRLSLPPTFRRLEVPVVFGAFVVLRAEGLIAREPLWLIGLLLLGASLISDAASRIWPDDSIGAGLWLRTGVVAAGITAVMYVTGWGPMLAIGYAWLAGDQVSRAGSAGARPALVWSLVCLVGGQVAIALGIAPSFVDTPDVYGLAVLSALGLVVAVRLVERSTRAQEEAELGLRQSEHRFRSLVANASDVIVAFKPGGTVSYVSPAYERIIGPPSEGGFVLTSDLLHPDDRERTRELMQDVLAAPGEPQWSEVRLRDERGDWHWFEVWVTNRLDDPSVDACVANLRDITDRKLFEEELTYQAYHDALTGLPNRPAFLERLQSVLDHPSRLDRVVGVLFMDVDRFKLVNDSLGHEIGDRLLVELGERLRSGVRPGDLVARFGGDEFTVLLRDLDSEADAVRAAERILELLREPVKMASRELVITASIGIAVATSLEGKRDDASDLLRQADLAMYTAKDRGRARCEVFDPRRVPQVVERLELESSLWRAVDEGELVVHFQPEVSLVDGAVVALEALVRWNHPERGMLSPDAFVSFAEESSLIVAIDRYVLRSACKQLASWRERKVPPRDLTVSVNLSPRFVHQPDAVSDIVEVLDETGIDPEKLQLEITERTALVDRERTIETLSDLRERGIRVAIDDFGTGYSSLSYLRHFPIDVVKLDKSFIDGIGTLESGAAIVEAVITMGHALGMRITAEGVERAEQVAELRTLGCDAAQGFHFARPLAPRALEDLLSDQGPEIPGTVVPLRRRDTAG